MNEFLNRTELLLGEEAISKMKDSCVAVIGLGGVGSYATEILARSGVGKLVLVDFDTVSVSNINRQLPALHSTVGRFKTEVMQERILDINPNAEVKIYTEFIDETNRDKILENVDFVIDAIDSLNPKINLLEFMYKKNIQMISVMGAGGKTDPSKIRQTDLFKTKYCPLARRVRKFLRRRGIKKNIPAIYTDETPAPQSENINEEDTVSRGRQRGTISSISYLPAMMGMWAASYVIDKLSSD